MNSRLSEISGRVPPVGRGRALLRVTSGFLISAVSLVLALELFPWLGSLGHPLVAVGAVVGLSILQVVLWPVFIRAFLGLFYRVSPGFMFVVFPAFSLLLTTLFIMVGSLALPYFVVNGLAAAFLLAGLLTVISMVIASIFSIEDEPAIYQRTLKRMGERRARAGDADKLGLVFLEIDGLGERVLREAMDRGKVPLLKHWLESGSHRLVGWESDLSSQSSAAQAGILHGNNSDMPGFRWYDKQKKRVVVSSSTGDVAELEERVSDGNGLMSNGGAARGSLFSGDATHVVLTASRVFDVTSADLGAYYLNPFGLVRSLWLMAWDIILEKKAAWAQRLRNDQPRVNRGGTYFILRALMTVLVRDFCLATLRGDMYSGIPYAYATLGGYDEVAHHSGIRRPDALEIVRKLDREFAKLEMTASYAMRKYRFVILSDHGQSQGRPFSDRYGETLENLVSRLLNEEGMEYGVTGYETRHESAYYINAAFGYSKIAGSGVGSRVSGALDRRQQVKVGRGEEEDVVVLASGNLGLISFTFAERRLTLEDITLSFPAVLSGLADHPGIGFVMVRSRKRGPVVIGKKGLMYLENGEVAGEDPLADYGPYAASLLLREDSFSNAPDVLVVSTYWPDTDEVAAFENLVGSHGGIGGDQSRPFILYPSELELEMDRIVGAEQVYRVFKRWTTDIVGNAEKVGDTPGPSVTR